METQLTRPMFKAICKIAGKTGTDEIFPEFFSFPPATGDFVQSQSGKAYKIVSIIHTAKITKGKYGDIQTPVAVLVLERP
jgi:hypothetical protein